MIDSSTKIRPVDVGSFPLDADLQQYLRGAFDLEVNAGRIQTNSAQYFIDAHNETFRAKVEAMGPELAVTSYAQCRGMIDQFLLPVIRQASTSLGIQRELPTGFGEISKEEAQTVAIAIATGKNTLSAEKVVFPEIIALEHGAQELSENLGVDRISYKACITGPLELSLNLQRIAGLPRTYDEKLMNYFTEVVKAFFENSIVKTKYLTPEIISLDDPTFGLEGLGDFFTDTASDPKLEHLISCWNEIYNIVPSDCYRGLHLHSSPFEQVFHANWNLLEAHVGVFVNRQWLENYDKFVRAAVVRTDGPTINQESDVKAAWQDIYAGNYEPYLQPVEEMEKHLKSTIDLYGMERVPFYGPECGLGPWDWNYGKQMAISTLHRMRSLVT